MDKILFVEDNQSIVQALLPALQLNHFEVVHAADVKAGKKAVLSGTYSLVILDVNLPDGNGLDLCKEIHDAFPTLPIIFLTARAEEQTAVEGFESGAIDYVRKPFSNTELIARIRRGLSRHVGKPVLLQFGKLSLEPTQRRAQYGEAPLELTRREFDLLVLMTKRAGGAVTRDEILSLLDDDGELLDRTIDSHISHLRKKLAKAAGKDIRINSVYGVGYRLEAK